ncbi:MAG TPA: peroxiredoxin [Thermoanaerobaculia bacterium]|nr:peroxiredoxin [Thermoanaerobaculia bacterium]
MILLTLIGLPVLTFAGLAEPGQPAPTFTLSNYNGVPFSLEKFRGSWVVLYFYPDSFSAASTMQAIKFRRDMAKYHEHKAYIVGVSVATEDTNRQFREMYSLGFSLLADTNANVAKSYGSTAEHDGKLLPARNTFLINPEGKIAKVFRSVDPAKHSAEVLDALRTLSPLATDKSSEPALTNEGVVALAAADLGDEIVIAKIRTTPQVRFDISTDALVALKKEKTSSAIIAAMIERANRAPSASAPASTTASNAQSQTRAVAEPPANPCAAIELLGVFKEDMRPMSPLIIYMAKIRNSSGVTRIVRLEWLDMYGQAMQSTVQINAGQIATLQLAAQEPFQRQPINLNLASCR